MTEEEMTNTAKQHENIEFCAIWTGRGWRLTMSTMALASQAAQRQGDSTLTQNSQEVLFVSMEKAFATYMRICKTAYDSRSQAASHSRFVVKPLEFGLMH